MKTLRIVGFALFAILMCLSACSGGDDDPIEPSPKPEITKSEITIDSSIISNGLSFTNEKGEQSISFSTNENWTLSVASTTSGTTWCTASATSGSKGTATVKFDVAENTTYNNRSVSVTIKSGTASKTFTISQKGVDALLVTTDKYEVSQEGGTIEIEVKANISYKMEISEKAKDWIKESLSRSLTTYKHKLDIAANEEVEKREGEITFKSGDKVETVKVYQAGSAILLLSQNEYNVSDKGDTISVDIRSNVEFGVQMPDVDWIIDMSSSRGLSSHTLKFIVSANKEVNKRCANIIFYDKNSELCDSICVIQEGREYLEVNLDKAGSLSLYINNALKSALKHLKIKGFLNGNDIRIIREMSGVNHLGEKTNGKLETLDLADANIVEGGDAYFYPSNTSFATAYTNNGTIGRFMFADCKTLKRIILPSECTKIEEKGLSYCENLIEIVMSDKITSIGKYAISVCTKIQSINLPNSIESIERGAFEGCTSLDSLILPNKLTQISSALLFNCPQLKKIKIPESVKYIEGDAFAYCSSLKEIILPDSVEKIIGLGVFYKCSSINKIVLGRNFKEAITGCFDYQSCNNIKEIHCKALTPPICSFASHYYDATLYVPEKAYQDYISSQYWIRFKNVVKD